MSSAEKYTPDEAELIGCYAGAMEEQAGENYATAPLSADSTSELTMTADPYTPTVEEVRTDYVLAYADRDSSQLLAGAAFDRFIAKVRDEAKADALREAGAAVMGERLETETEAGNWLDERAERIEAGEA